MDNRNYSGPNTIGAPKESVPDWLDHTANSLEDQSAAKRGMAYPAPVKDAGPNAVGAVTNTWYPIPVLP